jgi:hypothetical protein
LRTKVAIGSAVIKEDWESVMPNWVKKSFGGVYGWCAHECIVAVRHWCERPIRRYQHPINWVFECGAEGWTQVAQMLTELAANPALKKQFRIGSWTFSGKDVIPLQAADTIAYEIFKQVENQILDHGDKHNVRFSMQNLIRPQDSHYLKYWNKERLREWLQNTMTAHYRVI